MAYRILMVMSAVGFFASLVLHLLACLDIEPPGGKSSVFTLIIAIGIFIVCVPAFFFVGRMKPPLPREYIDHLDLPRWLRISFYVLFGYAMLSFGSGVWQTRHLRARDRPVPIVARGGFAICMFFYGTAWMDFIGLARLKRKSQVMVLTPEAVQQVLRHRDLLHVTGPWCLRVEVEELGDGRGTHTVALDQAPPSPEDFEFTYQGIQVVVRRSHMEKLRGATVGYRADPDWEGFFVRNPHLPDSRE